MEYTPSWLPSILKTESYLKINAYFDGFKQNHRAQGAYAAASLGASEQQIWDILDFSANGRHKNYRYDGHPTQPIEVDSIKSDNIEDYLGSNVGYYRILDHFMKIFETKYDNDRDKFIAGELPRIIDGPLGGAFHGMIQCGYGYAALSDQVVMEGIAMFYQQYEPVFPKDIKKARDLSNFGKGSIEPLDLLKSIAENEDLINGTPTLTIGMKNHMEDYMKLADSIKLPDWFDASKEDMNDILKLVDWLLDICTYVYVRSSHVNGFFLLHGITGVWSLRQVIHLVDFKTALTGIRAHLIAFLIVYADDKGPALTKSPSDYWKGDVIDQAAWNKVIQNLLSEPREEHRYKVTQCLYQQWKRHPDSTYAKYYIAGAEIVVSFPFEWELS